MLKGKFMDHDELIEQARKQRDLTIATLLAEIWAKQDHQTLDLLMKAAIDAKYTRRQIKTAFHIYVDTKVPV